MERNWSWPQRMVGLVALVVGVYGVFVGLVARGDVTRLVVAGDRFVDKNELVSPIVVRQNSDGYDGEFNYRMALDPFTNNVSDFGVTLDKPIIRQRRIVYPLLVWFFSLGRAELVPWGLVGINLVGVMMLVGLVASEVVTRKKSWWWVVVLGLIPGLVLSVGRNLPEPWVLVWLWLFVREMKEKKYWRAALVMAVALVTKETVIVVAGAYLLIQGFEWVKANKKSVEIGGWKLMKPMVAVFGAVGVFGLYHLWLVIKWQTGPAAYFSNNVGLPLVGLVKFGQMIPGLPFDLQVTYGVELGWLVWMGRLVLTRVKESVAPVYVKWAWMIYGVMAVCFSNEVWVEDWSFLRVMAEWMLLGWLIVMGAKYNDKEVKKWGLISLGVWVVVAVDVVMYRV